jgi:hypothetical protein
LTNSHHGPWTPPTTDATLQDNSQKRKAEDDSEENSGENALDNAVNKSNEDTPDGNAMPATAEEVHVYSDTGDRAHSASSSTFPASNEFPTQQSSAQEYSTQEYTSSSGFPTQQLSARSDEATMISDASRLPPVAGLEDVPIISEDVDVSVLPESQLINYVRQAKDAYSQYFPEGREPVVQSERAMILLAKNVTDAVFESRFLPIKARYLLDEHQDLYIRKVPGWCHGAVNSRIIGDCGLLQS